MSRFATGLFVSFFSFSIFAESPDTHFLTTSPIGLAGRPSLANLVAVDPAASAFVVELDAVLSKHAADFNSYVQSLISEGPYHTNPDLVGAIMLVRGHHRQRLSESPYGRMVLAHTAHLMNLERLLKLETLTELAKGRVAPNELHRTLQRIALAKEETLKQLRVSEANLELRVCSQWLKGSGNLKDPFVL